MGRLSEENIAAWYPCLFRTALRLTGSQQDACDLTQQAFCNAISRWQQFDGHSKPITWLHRILINGYRDFRRREGVRQAESFDEWAMAGAARGDAVEDAERQEELRELRKVIAGLSDTLRRTFVATVLDGYSYQQAAEMLSVPVGTVASRVHQARQQLQVEMRNIFPES